MADAIYTQILDAVKVAINAHATLGLVFTSDNTFVTRRLSNAKQLFTQPPALLIAPFGSKRLLPGTNIQTDIAYPVAVVTIAKTPDKLTDDLDTSLQWHESLIRLFNDKRLDDVVEVQRGTVDPRDVFEPAAWMRDFDVGASIFRFQTREART